MENEMEQVLRGVAEFTVKKWDGFFVSSMGVVGLEAGLRESGLLRLLLCFERVLKESECYCADYVAAKRQCGYCEAMAALAAIKAYHVALAAVKEKAHA